MSKTEPTAIELALDSSSRSANECGVAASLFRARRIELSSRYTENGKWVFPLRDGRALSVYPGDAYQCKMSDGEAGDVSILNYGLLRFLSENGVRRTHPHDLTEWGRLPLYAPVRYRGQRTAREIAKQEESL